MKHGTVSRDERTLAVENASYRLAFQVFAYGLLVIVAYRSYASGEAPGDLLVLAFLGGAAAALYQWSRPPSLFA